MKKIPLGLDASAIGPLINLGFALYYPRMALPMLVFTLYHIWEKRKEKS